MNAKPVLWIFILLLWSINAVDYLGGNGIFNDSAQLTAWLNASDPSPYNNPTIYTDNNGDTYLNLTKPGTSAANFNDGIYYHFGNHTPQHIHYEVSTNNITAESGDIRLVQLSDSASFSRINERDSLFFRLGFYGYVRFNLKEMVMKYTNGTWYTVDFILDWNRKKIALYIDNNFKTNQKFYYDEDITYANAIILYNLAPDTTSLIRNLEVCDVRWSRGADLQYQSAAFINVIKTIFLVVVVTIMLFLF